MIKVSNVSLYFDEVKILSSICLNLKAQKTHALLGPSGCGKSTLLKIILGIHKPTKGDVFINGTLLTAKNYRQFVQKIGYCVQDGGLFPSLTAKENVLLISKLRKNELKTTQERLKYLCELVQVEEKTLGLYPSMLSGWGEAKNLFNACSNV